MESQIDTAVMYDPDNNKVNFYIDGKLTSRTLFTARMNENFVNGKPVKLYEYEVEFIKLKDYIKNMVKYSNGFMAKMRSTDSRKKAAQKILKKIIEGER